MKIGIYGGTFNPPHIGHINAVRQAARQLGFDKLIIMPAGIPPHKEMPENTPAAEKRLEMANIAFSDIENCTVSDYELKSSETSYTINTVKHLIEEYPDAEMSLLMGTDMFITLDSWRSGDEILKLVTPVVFARGAGEYMSIKAKADEYFEKYNCRSVITEINITEIASTKLRERLQNRQGREYFSDALYAFIIKNRCYGAKPDYEWLREKSYAMHKTKRIPHVRGCEEEAVRLAERWGADIDDARTSGILHDITKKCNLDEQLILCRKYGILTDTLESVSEKLLHSKTGAAVARSEFGVNDKVFNAIYWHTTGKENMTLLEKVLYLADYIEPNRDFDGVEPLRKLCYEDIDAAMKLGLEMSIEDLEQRGSPIHRHTLDAFKFYKMRKDEE